MAASGAIWVKVGRGSNIHITVVPYSTVAHYAHVNVHGNLDKAKMEIKSLSAMVAKRIADQDEITDMLSAHSEVPVKWSMPKPKGAQAAPDGVKAYQEWVNSGKPLNDGTGSSPTAAPTHLPGGVKVKTWEEKGQAIRQTGEAWKQGALAVHQPLVKTGQTDQTWTITHLPTGLSAVSAIKTQAEAIQAMQYLNTKASWSFLSAGGGHGLPKDALTAIQAVQHQLYSNLPMASLLKPKKAAAKKAAPRPRHAPTPGITLFDTL